MIDRYALHIDVLMYVSTKWLTVVGLFVYTLNGHLSAQELSSDSLSRSLRNRTIQDILPSKTDSLGQVFVPSDSASLREAFNNDPATVGQPSSDSAEVKITYGSKDSSFNDMSGSRVHLYGDAYVRYDEFEVTADYILFNFMTNEVEASTRIKNRGKPTFKSGDQNVEADKIRYNIDTEKGIIHGARVIQNNLFVHGAVTKIVKAGADSLHIDDVVYNRNALITTCDAEHPHWGIRTTKLKLIPDKIAIIGPANMELAGIPLPLVLPFAFAPLFDFSQGGTSGLIFPQDPFYRSPELGLGMRGIGYYFALSDRMDLSARAEVYTRGSWGLTLNSNYKKRYKHTGSVNLAYSRQLREVSGELRPNIDQSYSITINHNQDSKAHPYRTIGGSLRFTVNDFDRKNFEAASAQLNSQINSNFNYSYKLSNKVNFIAGLNHSQNTQTRIMTFTLPQMQLRMNRIFPFKLKKGNVNQEKWFEKINMQYDGKFQNTVTTGDSILFTKETLGLFRSGFSHRIDAAAAYNLFDNVTFNVTVNHDEFWYLHTSEYELDTDGAPTPVAAVGFKPLRETSISANLATNIFGTMRFAKGWLRGLRHQMTPTIGMSFRPSTLDKNKEFRFTSLNSGLDSSIVYNPFRSIGNTNLFNSRNLDQGGFSINYGIANTFEGKHFSKRDSTEKKFRLFNSVNLGGSYNVSADSLQWSPISLTANAQILKNLATLSINGAMDPYDVDERGLRINKTLLSQGKGLLRFSNFSASLSTSFSLRQIRDFFRGEEPEDVDYSSSTDSRSIGQNQRSANEPQRSNSNDPPELFSWFEDFKIQYNIRVSYTPNRLNGAWDATTHSIQLTTGMIPLTDKWGMQVGNLSYDIGNARWVYPSFSLARDLHCWQLSISWQPQNNTYSFFVGVKAAPFSNFLKYQGGRSQFDRRF